ncbi:MAG: MaoC family dehydratase [Bacilli bacterium]|nr:MaoC family dehydratase [Bacilli bacterium]
MNSTPFKKLQIGDHAQLSKAFHLEEVEWFAKITGDNNPLHLDEEYAQKSIFKTRIVHGMLVSSLFSSIFGTILPGLGSIYLFQSMKFIRPVYLDEEVTAKVTVKELINEKKRVVFDCVVINSKQEVVITGEAILLPPKGDNE